MTIPLEQESAMTDDAVESQESTAAVSLQVAEDEPFKTVGEIEVDSPRMKVRHVDVFYGDKQAIFDVSLDIAANEVIAMIGPSGCGKSTFIRCLNRMNDTIESCRVTGEIKLDGMDIYDPQVDVVPLRAQVKHASLPETLGTLTE